ncbi:hypothetical protein [Maribacter sp. 2307UL18-2]|uniref:hypothetical protein n=1 Tax=Maribacter sp. 2307UL18-2 TaxID=3386274 RepID=UPI0039BC4482
MGSLLKIVEDVQNEIYEPPKNQFWKIKRNQKDANKYVVLPDTLGFISYLESLGVCFESSSRELVIHEKGIVSKIDISDLKRIVQKNIQRFPDVSDDGATKNDILSMVMANEARLFKVKGLLEFLPLVEFPWVASTESVGYFFYRNGLVEVSEVDIVVKPYESMDGFIWDTQVIDRDFELVEPEGTDWADFVYKAAGSTDELVANLNAALGYTLHAYKDPSKAFLVLFGEAVEDSNKGGGAGKGLTGVGISKIVNTAFKDMRQYSASDPFKFSMVNQDTQVLVLSDLKPNFKHDILYNMITESLEINAKNTPVAVYPFSESPKLLASTNYSLDDEAGHGNRRLRLVEFSSFWNASNTPDKHYGKLLFDQWDETEWAAFDSYMLLAVAQYLKNGFPKVPESESSKRKRILGKPGMIDLMEWLENYVSDGYSSFADTYIDYSRSKYISKSPIGKNVFLSRLEEAINISGSKSMDIAENGSVKSLKIW